MRLNARPHVRYIIQKLLRSFAGSLIGAGILLLTAQGLDLPAAVAASPDSLTGREIMARVWLRQQTYPFVYSEQTMILTDASGQKDTRKLRRYFRTEGDGSMNLLVAMDHPAEVRGVMLKIIRDQDGKGQQEIYLPALGKSLISQGRQGGEGLMGTDFSQADLLPAPKDTDYLRKKDLVTGRVPYFIIETNLPSGGRIHFVRKDNYFIARTDFYTPGGRHYKRLTRHDLKRGDKKMWEADMVLMENLQTGHHTLIKTDRRIYSRDYVRPAYFTMGWKELTRVLWPDVGPPAPQEETPGPEAQ